MPAQGNNGTYVPAHWAGRGNCRRPKAPAITQGWRSPAAADWEVQPRAGVTVRNGP
ncbi:hypothetical protein NicSoilC12_21540 [Arthrobacter sp. NicSoilC12]|nr:hypothetical protein NicSoilC12_21540 [Arthrobacter sp. NicSoilC12]